MLSGSSLLKTAQLLVSSAVNFLPSGSHGLVTMVTPTHTQLWHAVKEVGLLSKDHQPSYAKSTCML